MVSPGSTLSEPDWISRIIAATGTAATGTGAPGLTETAAIGTEAPGLTGTGANWLRPTLAVICAGESPASGSPAVGRARTRD